MSNNTLKYFRSLTLGELLNKAKQQKGYLELYNNKKLNLDMQVVEQLENRIVKIDRVIIEKRNKEVEK